jgi:hypothetical protein
MRHGTPRHPRSRKLPVVWRDLEYDARQAEAADSFDDRVSEDIFDIDDERAEIESIVHGMSYRAN